MRQRGQGVHWWLLGSAALALVGAFGPWLRVLGQSVGGTDGSNDGWLVVAAAGLGALLYYLNRAHRIAGMWGLLGGIAGTAVTLYDRSNVQNAIDQGGTLAAGLVQVGWGLNLALAASVSLAIAGAVSWYSARPGAQPEPLSSEPPPAAAPSPPSMPPPAAPTPPPE